MRRIKWAIYAICLAAITTMGYMERTPRSEYSVLSQTITILTGSPEMAGDPTEGYEDYENYAESLTILSGPGCRWCVKQKKAVKELIQAGYKISFEDVRNYKGPVDIVGLPTLIFIVSEGEELVLLGYQDPELIEYILRGPND